MFVVYEVLFMDDKNSDVKYERLQEFKTLEEADTFMKLQIGQHGDFIDLDRHSYTIMME